MEEFINGYCCLSKDVSAELKAKSIDMEILNTFTSVQDFDMHKVKLSQPVRNLILSSLQVEKDKNNFSGKDIHGNENLFELLDDFITNEYEIFSINPHLINDTNDYDKTFFFEPSLECPMNASDILLSSSSPKRTAHSSQIPGSKHAEPSKQTNSTQQLDRKRTGPIIVSNEDILPPKILKSTRKGTFVQKSSRFPSNYAIHLEQSNKKSVVESASHNQLPVLKQTLETVSQLSKARCNVTISNHRKVYEAIGVNEHTQFYWVNRTRKWRVISNNNLLHYHSVNLISSPDDAESYVTIHL